MLQKITGFHLDHEEHWVAELECGHGQHVRHDPPWTNRPWVLTDAGRKERLNQELNCKRCDDLGMKVAGVVLEECKLALNSAYRDAGFAGLCAEGRWEAALGALQGLNLMSLAERALR